MKNKGFDRFSMSNLISKTKIETCDYTFNPVWGCLNHCEYCYARKITKRFWAKMIEVENNYHHRKHQIWAFNGEELRNLHDFKPTFLYSQFDKKFPKKPQRIFVGSMSDIGYWEEEWMERVLNKIRQYPQHIFQFLAKYPKVYRGYKFSKNCWLGVTITKEKDFYNDIIDFLRLDFDYKNIKYVSFEPLLSKILSYKLLKYFDWVIIGAETGNRKGKVIPKREWIENIVSYCREQNIPVYLKDSLKGIYPVEIKEFPI